jgi:polyisoprenoid-binding protein YceI
MKNIIKAFISALFIASISLPLGFNLPSKGNQHFNLRDTVGRNQATFFSEARYENITGLANDVWGKVSFDRQDVSSTLKGKVSISTSSLKTGIEKRDEQLQGLMWLYAEKYPDITFEIRRVLNVYNAEDNVIKVSLTGDFTLRGQTRIVYANATIKYLPESELTQTIRPGDLINIMADFEINLSDFRISNTFIGNRVSDNIKISANLVGSDAEQRN